MSKKRKESARMRMNRVPSSSSWQVIPLTDFGPDNYYDENLNQAIIDDKVEIIKQYLVDGDEDQIKILTSKRQLPVLVAIEYNSTKCLRYLLELHNAFKYGNDNHNPLNLEDVCVSSKRAGQHILHIVARRPKETEVVEILEQYAELFKAFINKPDKNEVTPLLTAVKSNNTAMTKFLVQHKACFDKNFGKKGQQQSAIYIAVIRGQLDVLKYMMDLVPSLPELYKNGDLFGKGHTIFFVAVISRNDELFHYLLEKIGVQDAKEYLIQEMQHRDYNKFLEIITAAGMKSAIESLMKLSDFHARRVNDCPPLYWAVKGNHLEIVKLLLNDQRAKDTVDDRENIYGRNIFHYAAELQDSKILNYLMMKPEYLELHNKKDKRGCSPLHHAAVANSFKNVNLLLERKMLKMNHDSIFHCAFCVRYTSIEILRIIFEKIESKCDKETLQSRFLQVENRKQRAPLHQAAYSGRLEILKLLLEKNASLDLRSTYFNWTVLHFAVAGGSLDTISFLLQKLPEPLKLRTDNDETATVLAAEDGQAETLRFLIQKGGIVSGDSRIDNLLDAVTRYKHRNTEKRRDAAMVIMRYCDENGGVFLLERLMKDSVYGAEGIMSRFVKQMPYVAAQILDRCSQNIDSVDEQSTHKYHLFPIQDHTKQGLETLTTIRKMIKYKRYDLLRHPVVVKFLDEKWNKSSARIWYLFDIVLYATFLLSLTVDIAHNMKELGSLKMKKTQNYALLSICIIGITFNMVKEILQLRYAWRKYFLDFSNWLELTIYLTSLIYLLPVNEKKTAKQIRSGAIAILLAWINFIWFFKRLSLFGIYIIMAKKVFTSLLKVLPMVVLFIFAFSMSFSLLLHDDDGFKSIPKALLTTSVMMIGEIDYRDTFFHNKTGHDDVDAGGHITLARIILLFFLIVITIVIMNLLVGLAVGDTDDTMKRSKEEKLFFKASLIVTLQHTFAHVRFIGLSDVKDPLKVNMRDELKKMPWYMRLWNHVYKIKQLDNADETEKILSRLLKLESTMASKIAEMHANSMAEIRKQLEEISRQKVTVVEEESSV